LISRWRRALVLASLLLLAACANRGPDLARLYQHIGTGRPHPPVIIIPGLLGATLERDGVEIFPGGWSRFVTGDDFPELALPIDGQRLMPRDNGVRPAALFDKLVEVDFYNRIRETLRKAGRYHFAQPGTPVNDPAVRRQYVFLYDWRQDLAGIAAQLDRFVEQIRADYGDPQLRVDVVAHSMGGLLVRYFSLFGGEDVLSSDGGIPTPSHAGAAKLRKAVLIGTPNLGALNTLGSMVRGYRLGLARVSTEVELTMPAAYQLLPHPDREWIIASDGSRPDRDLYDPETWRQFGWGPYDPDVRKRVLSRYGDPQQGEEFLALLTAYFEHQLRRARDFHRAIALPTRSRYILFGGDCELTPARCLVERGEDTWKLRLDPRKVVLRQADVNYEELMLEPGDGNVTKTSLLARSALNSAFAAPEEGNPLAVAYSILLCERHFALTGNVHFRDNLLNVLLLQETTEDLRRPVKLPAEK
jgi:pimeloyl-ACP methyl ester carboxylesterase